MSLETSGGRVQKIFFTHFVCLCVTYCWAAASISVEHTVDFQSHPAYIAQSHDFEIKNTGDSMVELKQIRSTCGCLVPKFEKVNLSPGESYSLNVTVAANSVVGEYNKTLYLETNQPDQRFIQLNVKGNAIPLIEVEPKTMLYVGKLKVSKEYQYSFILTPTVQNVELKLKDLPEDAPATSTLVFEDGKYFLNIQVKSKQRDTLIGIEQEVLIVSPQGHAPIRIVLRGKIES